MCIKGHAEDQNQPAAQYTQLLANYHLKKTEEHSSMERRLTNPTPENLYLKVQMYSFKKEVVQDPCLSTKSILT